ncbi:MAG TPA: tetratricopeptide repeat protein [Candidatus Gracilibacteria bacterium]
MNKRWFVGLVIFLCLIILALLGVILDKEREHNGPIKVQPAKNDAQIFRDRTLNIPTEKEETPPAPPVVKTGISYQASIEESKNLIDHGYYSNATILLSDLIRKKADNIAAYLVLGDIYLQTNDLAKLTKLIESLEARFPGDAEVALLRTRKWILEGKFVLVLEMLESFDNPTPNLRWYQMVLYSLQNNHEKAKEILAQLQGASLVDREEKARIEDWGTVYKSFDEVSEGKNAHLFALFAKVLAEHNEAFLAKHFADLAIKDEIGYIDAWVLRGYSYFLMQQYQVAEADFRHAYSLDTTRPETQYFLGLTLYELENYEEAVLYFEQVLEYDFEFSESVRWKLVEIFSNQKKYEKALEMYETLLSSEEDPHRFISAVDMAVNILGKPEVALHFTEELIKKDPDNIFLTNLYAWALIANKQYFEAEQTLNDLLEQDPYYARTHLNLGLLYEEQQKFTESRVYYKNAYLYGKSDPKLLSIVNLASERYNALLEKEDRPDVEEVLTDRQKNSP